MALLPLLRKLKELEEGVSITDPITAGCSAYLITPDRNEVLAQATAVFENFPEPTGSEGRIGSFREDIETVRVRFTAYDADFDRGCEIAIAFYDAFKDAIDDEREAPKRLGGTFDHVTLRVAENPLQSFEGRPGWEMLLDFQIFQVVV